MKYVILVFTYKIRYEWNTCNDSFLSVANFSRKFSKLENSMHDHKKFSWNWQRNGRRNGKAVSRYLTTSLLQTECNSDYNITLNNQIENYKQLPSYWKHRGKRGIVICVYC